MHNILRISMKEPPIYIYIYGGCPSDPMMTFVFHNSSMNTVVASQPQA